MFIPPPSPIIKFKAPAPLFIFALLTLASVQNIRSEIRIPPDPGVDYRPESKFTVTANGKAVRTFTAKVSTMEAFKSRKTGIPNDSAELAFTTLDADEPVNFKVTVHSDSIKSATVKPSSYGVELKRNGSTMEFTAPKPGSYALQLNGSAYELLYLFVKPIEKEVPTREDPNTLIIPPGVHKKNIDVTEEGQKIYLSPGSVIMGRIAVKKGIRNVKVFGRGFIDGEQYTFDKPPNLIKAQKSDGLVIEGVTLLDSATWNIRVEDTTGLKIRHVSIIGYRQNSDGIDPCSCQDTLIEDCFIRNSDDCIVIKILKNGNPISKNIEIKRCVATTDHGAALKIGANELLGDEVSNVTFSDCDILLNRGTGMSVMNGGTAKVSHIYFRDIRVEDSRIAEQFSKWQKISPTAVFSYCLIGSKNAYLKEYTPGTNRHIYFEKVRCFGEDPNIQPKFLVRNQQKDLKYNSDDLFLNDVQINGKPMTSLTPENSLIDKGTSSISIDGKPALKP